MFGMGLKIAGFALKYSVPLFLAASAGGKMAGGKAEQVVDGVWGAMGRKGMEMATPALENMGIDADHDGYAGTNPDGSPRQNRGLGGFALDNWGALAAGGAGLMMGKGIMGRLLMAVGFALAAMFLGSLVKGKTLNDFNAGAQAPQPALQATSTVQALPAVQSAAGTTFVPKEGSFTSVPVTKPNPILDSIKERKKPDLDSLNTEGLQTDGLVAQSTTEKPVRTWHPLDDREGPDEEPKLELDNE